MINRHASDHDAKASFVVTIARHRWYWVPALYLLTLFLVLMVTLSQNSGGSAQLMYRGF